LINALRAVITVTDRQVVMSSDGVEDSVCTIRLVMRHSDADWDRLQKEGRITAATLAKLWQNYPTELHPKLVALLDMFGLAFHDPGQRLKPEIERDIIVPCLVTFPSPSQSFTDPVTLTWKLATPVAPLGFVSRLVVHVLNMVQEYEVFPTYELFAGGCGFDLDSAQVQLDGNTPGQIQLKIHYLAIRGSKPKDHVLMLVCWKTAEEIYSVLRKQTTHRYTT
jgi:hypothetical protein